MSYMKSYLEEESHKRILLDCPCCGETKEVSEEQPAYLIDEALVVWVCSDCYNTEYFWCDSCNKHHPYWKLNEMVWENNQLEVCDYVAFMNPKLKRPIRLKEKPIMPSRTSDYYTKKAQDDGNNFRAIKYRIEEGHSFRCPTCNEVSHPNQIYGPIFEKHHIEICNRCAISRQTRVKDYINQRFNKEPEGVIHGYEYDTSASASLKIKPDRKTPEGGNEFWCCDCHEYVSYLHVNTSNSKWVDDKISTYCTRCRPHTKKISLETPGKPVLDFNPQTIVEAAETAKSKGELPMFNANKLFGGEIGQDNTGRFKMSMLGLAIKNTTDGSYASYDGTQMVDVMDMVMPGMDGGIFKLPVTEVEVGDLIVQGKEVYYVREVREDGGIEALNPQTNKVEVLMPAGNLMGFKFFIKVVSMFDGMFGGGVDADNPMGAIQPFIMMQMFSGGGMGGMFGGSSSSGSKDGGGNMMEMFMMMQMFGGGGKGGNPFEKMFSGLTGTKKAKPLTAAQKKAAIAKAANEAANADA